MNIENAINTLKPFFPNVKFVEAEDPQLEDNQIEMDDTYVIQLCLDGSTMVTKVEGSTVHFGEPMTLADSVNKVINS